MYKDLVCFLLFFILFIQANELQGKTADDSIKLTEGNKLQVKNSTSSNNELEPPRLQPSSEFLEPLKPPKCKDQHIEDISTCPTGLVCSKLGGNCMNCTFNCSCIYGQKVNVTCTPKKGLDCTGSKTFEREMTCQYCYQTQSWQHNCAGTSECPAVSSPRTMFKTNCTVNSDVVCLGNRNFPKRIPCNWTSGHQWSTALILSITLGGFGADRFYLGHWQEGIGKLFSFGGLGVWTIIDVILIAIRYLGPANESLYI